MGVGVGAGQLLGAHTQFEPEHEESAGPPNSVPNLHLTRLEHQPQLDWFVQPEEGGLEQTV